MSSQLMLHRLFQKLSVGFLAIFVVFLMKCSFQVGIPRVSSQKTPVADSTLQMDIYAKFTDLVHFGILNHVTDFSGIPLQYTVVDSNENPIPYARIVSNLDSTRTMFRTNAQGQAFLAFDSLAIMRHPKVYGVKNHLTYSVTIDFGFSGEPGGQVEIADITSLQPKQVGADLMLFNTLSRDSMTVVATVLRAQRSFIQAHLQLVPIHWATAIMPIGKTYTTPQTSYYFDHTNYNVFAYSTDHIYQNLVFVNIHEWVEQTILHRIHFTGVKYRWLTDGIAEWAPWAFYAQLSDTTRSHLDLPHSKIVAGIDKLIHYLKQSKQHAFGLKNWKVIHTNSNQELPTLQFNKEAIRYKVAASFWFKVAQYDPTILPRFLSQLSQMPTVSDQEVIQQLDALLPPDLQALLQNFPVEQSIQVWQQYRAQLK